MRWPEFHKATFKTELVNTDRLLPGELDTQYAYFSHRQPTLEESFCFMREQCLETLRGLLVAATLKVSRTQISLFLDCFPRSSAPNICSSLQELKPGSRTSVCWASQTSAQNLRSRPSRTLLCCPCLHFTLRHWGDSWEGQFNFKGKCELQILDL